MARPASNFTTRVATLDDFEGITAVYFDAFSGGYIGSRCFPAAPRSTMVIVTDNDSSPPGRVVGFAKWTRPHSDGEEPYPESHDPLMNGPWPTDGNPALAEAFFTGIERKRRETMGDRKFWFLHILAVHSDYQGRGASSSLLRWGVGRAQEDKLPCYLDASPGAKPIYEKYGFREVDRLVFGDNELIETHMVREIVPSSEG
ncbi:unnamed protein product [Parascedosporium putredinis]|uniref:N-acetyltransferase domain-containing protein n=1 Tax=Parascedosporium putredinis TaxID=1442378 RepID=A0A9P1H2F5_9PEZI|nr:unnamed protein product [Parascedosporium putredinis]CAI7994904.1 unnamed protein product [Parascedosporium putredinis]